MIFEVVNCLLQQQIYYYIKIVIKIFKVYCNNIFLSTNLLSQILLQRFAYSDEAWSRQSSIQMDLNLRLSIYVEDRIGPSKVVTGVVFATMSPMPKLEWKKNSLLKRNSTVVSQRMFIRILMYLLLTMWGPYIGCLGF